MDGSDQPNRRNDEEDVGRERERLCDNPEEGPDPQRHYQKISPSANVHKSEDDECIDPPEERQEIQRREVEQE